LAIRGLGWQAALCLLTATAFAQISPGPLSRAHQTLEGATNCATCHNFGLGSRGLKCLECHQEIQREVTAHRGYHAIAYNSSPTEIDCARCHQEHDGRAFQITKFDPKKFDHAALAKFALEGKHRELACAECHSAKRIPMELRAEIKLKDANHSYVGLSKECTSCHRDVHEGQLGAACTNCHSQDAWKPAGGFQHSKTAYPLTGLHANVACEKCHGPKPGESAAKYKGLTFSACTNCHNDPHRGAFQEAKFSGTCQSCHTTSGWRSISSHTGFDHDATRFPLHGKHAEVECSRCHKNEDFRQPVAHALCGDCHEDVHHGQFAGRTAGADCSACHNEVSFRPSLFTKEMHQRSAFPLDAKHASADCAKCHLPEGKDAIYKLNKSKCVDCHADPHAGEFAAAPYLNRCEECHSQQTFRPTTFSPARHSKTKFALTSAHAAVFCNDCHKPITPSPAVASFVPASLTKAANDAARQYHFVNQSCTGCHVDPHNTRIACDTCHNERQWRELRQFDHAATKFNLEGAHQATACIECHKPKNEARMNARNTKENADFSNTPKQCFECHQDVHGGQFLSAGKEKDCSTCHNVVQWKSGTFDHSKANFPLDGAHDKVACGQCHKDRTEVDGKTVRLYHGTPTQCADCHGNGIPPAR